MIEPIDKSTLLRLIHSGYERTDADYKRSMGWEGDFRYDIVKDVLAFSNRGGGWIIIGYDESKEDLESRLTGLRSEHIPSWDPTDVNKVINNHAGPPIDVDVILVEEPGDSRKYVVIHIPSHGSVPHLCIKDMHDSNSRHVLREAALYYRTKNKTCEEISDPIEYQALIRRCVIADGEKIIEEIRIILGVETDGVPPALPADRDPFEAMDRVPPIIENRLPDQD